MSKKTAAAIIAVVLALVAVHNFRRAYPEITWPIITSSLSEPESPSSNGSPYKFYYDNLTVTEKQAYNMILDKIYDGMFLFLLDLLIHLNIFDIYYYYVYILHYYYHYLYLFHYY